MTLGAVMWALNELAGYSVYGVAFAHLQAFVVVAVAAIRGVSAAAWVHLLFSMTSLEFHRVLYSGLPIYTYRTVSLFGVSLATLVLVLLWGYLAVLRPSIADRRRSSASRGRSLPAGWFYFLGAAGALTGLLGLVFDGYSTAGFARDAQFFIVVFMGFQLGRKLVIDDNSAACRMADLVLGVTLSRTLVVFVGTAAWGKLGQYGGLPVFSYDAWDLFTPLLLTAAILGVRSPKRRLLFLVAAAAALINIAEFPTGKTLLLTFVALAIPLVRFLSRPGRRRLIWAFALGLLAVVSLVIVSGQVSTHANELMKAKLAQVLDIIEWVKGGDLAAMSPSPRARVIEFLNIADCLLTSPQYLVAGRGFGGYFTDQRYPYATADTTAYSVEELETRRFYSPHESAANVLLKFGLIGLCLWMHVLLSTAFRALRVGQAELVFLAAVFVVAWGLSIGSSMKIAMLIGVLLPLVKTVKQTGDSRPLMPSAETGRSVG